MATYSHPSGFIQVVYSAVMISVDGKVEEVTDLCSFAGGDQTL